MAIPRLAWATLTIPPASQLNSTASSADARQISAAGSRSVIPLTYGTDRIGGLLLNVLPKAADATKLLVQVLWGFAGSAVASVQLNGLDLPVTATVTTYLGSQTTADSALVAAFSAQSITYVDTLQGFAYSIIEIAQSAIGSELQFTSLFTGSLLYDPRLDSTVAGGSGSNRLATPSTWSGAVDCPALALGNFLASTIYGASETVDWVSVIEAANANDATVGSPAEKRRTIGVSFISPSSVADVAEALRAYAGCFLIPSASGVKLLPDADGSAVATYSHTDGTIASITALQMRDLGNSPTSVEIIYTDTTVIPWRDASAFADLPGAGTTLPYRLSQVRMPGVKRYSQARREAIERLNKLTLQDLSTQIEVFDAGIRHQIGDIVSVSHPIGIAGKLFRVTQPENLSAGRWVLPLIEHDPACYSSVVETVPTYSNSGALISNASVSAGFYALSITVYQQAASVSAAPSGGSYVFTGDAFTAPAGWSRAQPTGSITPTWASTWLFETSTPTVPVLGPVGTADPYFSSVALLLHGNGSNGGTTFTDSSSFARTATRIGSAVTSTAHVKWGSASISCPSGSGLSFPFSSDLNLTGVDFTVESWAYNVGTSGFGTLVDFRGSGSFSSSWGPFINFSDRSINVYDGPTATTVIYSGFNSVPAPGNWFHWAVVRSGTTVSLWIDGFLVASGTYNPPATSATGIRVGLNQAGADFYNGFLDDLRITKSVARYTATFTVPAAQFPDSSIGSGGWPLPVKFVQDGAAGSGGLSVYTASVYKQTSSALSAPTGGTYNFSTGTLTPPTGWTVGQPASTATPTYVAEYTFSTSTPATAVTAGTWTAPVVDAVVNDSVSTLTLEIFKQASSAPSAPTGGSYTFSTDSFTPPSGWTRGQPASSTTPTYRTAFTFTTTTPATAVNATAWAAPLVVAQNGTNGVSTSLLSLTPETISLAADNTGFVASYSAAKTTAVVWSGNTDDTGNWTLSIAAGTGVTATLSGTQALVSAMTADTGYVSVTATRTGYTSLTKRFSLVKARSSGTTSGVVTGFNFSSSCLSATTSAQAAVRFNNDGTVDAKDNTSTYRAAGNWYTPTTSGIGASYWIKAVVSSGSVSGGTTGSVLAMPQSWNCLVSSSSHVVSNADLAITIYMDAAGLMPVATGTVSLDAETPPYP